MYNRFYTVFVSESGKHDHTAFLYIETESKEMYLQALKEIEAKGLKVSKVYKPSTFLGSPDFTKAINF